MTLTFHCLFCMSLPPLQESCDGHWALKKSQASVVFWLSLLVNMVLRPTGAHVGTEVKRQNLMCKHHLLHRSTTDQGLPSAGSPACVWWLRKTEKEEVLQACLYCFFFKGHSESSTYTEQWHWWYLRSFFFFFLKYYYKKSRTWRIS